MKTKKMLLLTMSLLLTISLQMGGKGAAAGNPGSQQEFLQWLEETGNPTKSVSGAYTASFSTYLSYNLIVYGSPAQVPGNEFKEGEYRYLGFTYLEEKYTNLLFPNDATGNALPENWNYIGIPGAVESWDSLEQTIQLPYMLYTKLSGHGASSLTAAGIGIDKARMQGAANWSGSGSIYTMKSNGYYATFVVPSMGMGVLDASMHPVPQKITAGENEVSVVANISLTASVNKPREEIKHIKVEFFTGAGGNTRLFVNTNRISINNEMVIGVPESIPGDVVISARVTAESIFGDKLERWIECTVTIVRQNIGENTPAPIPPPTVNPDPGNGGGSEPEPSVQPLPDGDDDDGSPSYIPSVIRSISISGAWNHWGDEMDHRFLSLEKVFIRIRTRVRTVRAVIRFSPELEAMSYTNSKGHTYDYAEDFFGEYVLFPGDSTLVANNGYGTQYLYLWDYILPMCPETIGWDGIRRRSSYSMTVTVHGYNGKTETISINDIDITGNIYNLLYPQPAD
ncbi:MAG: hypothetical protein JXB33_09085 [Clostridia bacterium]|nr:hypothetical protein [Clostridia bacterium]